MLDVSHHNNPLSKIGNHNLHITLYIIYNEKEIFIRELKKLRFLIFCFFLRLVKLFFSFVDLSCHFEFFTSETVEFSSLEKVNRLYIYISCIIVVVVSVAVVLYVIYYCTLYIFLGLILYFLCAKAVLLLQLKKLLEKREKEKLRKVKKKKKV